MRQLNFFTQHQCAHCLRDLEPSPRNPNRCSGFYDQDTKQYVCNTCRQLHYNKKNQTKFSGMYSEVPVPTLNYNF